MRADNYQSIISSNESSTDSHRSRILNEPSSDSDSSIYDNYSENHPIYDVRANLQNQDINPIQLPPDNQVNQWDQSVWLRTEAWDLKWIINVFVLDMNISSSNNFIVE